MRLCVQDIRVLKGILINFINSLYFVYAKLRVTMTWVHRNVVREKKVSDEERMAKVRERKTFSEACVLIKVAKQMN